MQTLREGAALTCCVLVSNYVLHFVLVVLVLLLFLPTFLIALPVLFEHLGVEIICTGILPIAKKSRRCSFMAGPTSVEPYSLREISLSFETHRFEHFKVPSGLIDNCTKPFSLRHSRRELRQTGLL